jgi:6,7-dimethyl-8-ribityllumazine synthase
MLKIVRAKELKAGGARFAIVASKYNGRYVEGMLRAARAVLNRAGAGSVQVVRVPGAFEIPVVAAKLAADSEPPMSAVICLGVILRGETTHAQHIGEGVSNALAQIQITHRVPIIHEVLLLENEEQARVRCLSKSHNRGAEAATTAIEMARTMKQL